MLKNFIEETATNPGTSLTVNLAGATPGRLPWIGAATFASGAIVFYGMDDGTQSEWGIGKVTAGTPNTLERTTVLGNSAGTTSRLNFSGAVRVYCEVPAEQAVYQDYQGRLSVEPGVIGAALWCGTAGGTENDLTLSATSAPPALRAGLLVRFRVGAVNTGAVTLDLNGLGSAPLQRGHLADALGYGDLIAGAIHEAMYDGSAWRLLTPGAQMSMPVGTIIDFAGTTPPPGYLLCNGQNVSRTTFSRLFAVIGTTYGAGNGTTTFGIPDLRGRATFGKDDMGGTAANRITAGISGISGSTLGAAGGSEAMQAHTHGVNDPGHGHTGQTYAGGIHAHPLNVPAGSGIASGPTTAHAGGGTGTIWTQEAGSHTHNFDTGTAQTGLTVNSSGSGSSQNMPPALIVHKIIYAGT